MARYGQDFDRGRFGYGMRDEYDLDYGYGRPMRGRYGGEFGTRYGGGEGGRFDEERFGYRPGYDIAYGGYGWTGYGGYGANRYGRSDFGYQGYGAGQGGYATDFADRTMGNRWSGYGYNRPESRPRGRWTQAGRVRASDVMTRDPETVTSDAKLTDAAQRMRDLNVGIIPVVESQESRRLKGVITDRDIAIRAVAEGRNPSDTRVADVMTPDIDTCNQNDTLETVMDAMERNQVRRIPITDREDRLVGIIAQADIAVDHWGGHMDRDWRVAEVLERISEPGRPQRGGQGTLQDQGTQRGGEQAMAATSARTRTGAQSRATGTQRNQPLQENA